MAMAVVPRSSCSSSVTEYLPLALPAQSDFSSWDDGLWRDVDLAERYLISSQFDEAAALCSTVLRKLMAIWESPEHRRHNDIDDIEMEGIMEAAGMVLIQACSESGRSGLIFKDLETIFGCTAKVPSSVLLAGLCLQISDGLYSEAQLPIESFLKHWAYDASNQRSCTFKPRLGHDHKCFCLTSERYIELVDLYCVQVLAKGLGRLDLARQWVKGADMPAERKEDMYEKLEKSLSRKEKTSLVSYPEKMSRSIPESGEYLSRPQDLECVEAESGSGVSKQVIKELNSHSSLKSIFLFSPVMDMLSRMSRSSMRFSDRVSRWTTMPAVVRENKLSFGGAATVILMIAIYRQRHHLTRLFGGLGKALQHVWHAVFISLYDFWQLAFNVQLNPLAAVQPLPPTHHGR